uniref:ephrin-A2-like n=1 Tax=Myxine glutinosa TaxID=7769 RepID=UPI00358F386C
MAAVALVLCAALYLASRAAAERFAVYWNHSNPRLLTKDYTLTAHTDDYMDIYCPHVPRIASVGTTAQPKQPPLTFRPILHLVDAEGFARCDHTRGAVRWRCDRPKAPDMPLRFAEKFQLYTPFSAGYEFLPGNDYYYISTPLLDNDKKCYRLHVYICCSKDDEKPGSTTHGDLQDPDKRPSSSHKGGMARVSDASSLCRPPAMLTLAAMAVTFWLWRSMA